MQAEVVFRVQTPFNTAADMPVYLEIVDEVTGLGLNPLRYQMESQPPNHHQIRLPVLVGSVIKYRYVLGSSPLAVENTVSGGQVRYRLFPVNSPQTVSDIVAAWSGTPYSGEHGRIFGFVNDANTSLPLPDVLVSAGGLQTVTAADGSFLLDGLPQGTHHLSAYSLDGSHFAYEQGALVSPGAATFAALNIEPAEMVNVTFSVAVPRLPVENASVRMLGNLYNLGNTFADLGGGINTLAGRSPELEPREDGRYHLTLRLPVGFDLRYKYSLGDGFWNAEHAAGRFLVRQLIVPAQDVVIEDTVETWSSGDAAAVVFILRTPANTPQNESVAIQFNPFAWLEPLPMWRAGANEWVYVLNSPLDLVGKVDYRFCRNSYCQEPYTSETYTFTKAVQIQYLQEQIEAWPAWSPSQEATTVSSLEIQPRSGSFVTGVEFAPVFHPAWSRYTDQAIASAGMLTSSLVVISPTWTYTRQNPPELQPLPGRDGLWADWVSLAEQARRQGVAFAVFPKSSMLDAGGLWEEGERDLSWWYSWYDSYQTFLLHHARLAEQTGAKALIIGGPDASPSYPNGKLPGGSPSGVPDEALSRWEEIISEVRRVYHGQLLLAVEYTGGLVSPPPFARYFDQIYLLWMAPVEGETSNEIAAAMTALLERDIRPLQRNTDTPLTLAVEFCSAEGGECGALDPGVNLQKQVELYNGALSAVNQAGWIGGFVSRGFSPPLPLEDNSASVYGKPAWDVLWYWYPRLLGIEEGQGR